MKKLIIASVCLLFVVPSQGETITVDDDGPADFNSIQLAIDVANQGDEIIVQPGLYEENINCQGKNITLTSTNPNNLDVASETIIHGSVVFRGTEDPNCMLAGFKINARIAGVDHSIDPNGENHTHATIAYCVLQGNETCGGTVMEECDGTINNCLIANNFTICLCLFPVIRGCHGLIKNCTIASNESGISVWDGGSTTIQNCIIHHNWDHYWPQVSLGSGATLTISYCDVQGGLEGIYLEDSNCIVNWESGNICTDPCFVRVGYWDEQLGQMVEGDYHLQSQTGRWDPNTSEWVTDTNTSLCIDAGDPNSDWTAELWPHGKRINMGAYGGTPQASMSLSTVGNKADLNNSDLVDYADLMGFVNKWLYQEILLPEDLDKNGVVNFTDFAILANEWQWEE